MDAEFIDPFWLLTIIIPLVVACITMQLVKGIHWAFLLRDLGVPIGLLISFIGFVGLLTSMNEDFELGIATATMLLGLICGGVLSAVGHFWVFRLVEFPSVYRYRNDLKWWAPSISITAFLATIIWAMNDVGYQNFTVSAHLAFFGFVTAVALIISGKKNVLGALSQSFLFSAMLGVLIGLVVFYLGNQNGLFIALVSIIYSLTSYICLYFASYDLVAQEKIDAPLMNWHWLEVSGFIIFMFLAPTSLNDYLSNIKNDKAEKKMELRVEELERQLDELKNMTIQ